MEKENDFFPPPTAEMPVSLRIQKVTTDTNCFFFHVYFKTNLVDFRVDVNELVRTHSDFLWLYQALKSDESISYFHIPPPPFLPDFGFASSLPSLIRKEHVEDCVKWIESRMESHYYFLFRRAIHMHETFLQELCKNPGLNQHHCFQMFLKPESKLASTEGTINSIMNFASKIYKKIETKIAESGASSLSVDSVDEEFERNKVFLKGYIEGLNAAALEHERAVNLGHLITVDIFNVEESIKKLSSVDSIQLKDFYISFAECLGKNRELDEKKLDTEDFIFYDLLRYYLNDSNECLDLMHFRTKLLAKYVKAKQAYSKAQSSGKAVIEHKVHCESLEKTLNLTTETIRKELSEQSETRIKRFSSNILSVCKLSISSSTLAIENLKNTISIMEAEDYNY